MGRIQIQIKNEQGEICFCKQGEEECIAYVQRTYRPGDQIEILVEEKQTDYWVSLDDAGPGQLLYLTDSLVYAIPFEAQRNNLSPKLFWGEQHLILVRKANAKEIRSYRNLAQNAWDQANSQSVFPHICANAETRGEAAFAVVNLIDGNFLSSGHGGWPYTSWGIGGRADARLHLDFGRKVEIDELVVYLRTDFPHDSWWEKATVVFSDGSRLPVSFSKKEGAQRITFLPRTVEWLEIGELQKHDEPAQFPSMVQVAVYGVPVYH